MLSHFHRKPVSSCFKASTKLFAQTQVDVAGAANQRGNAEILWKVLMIFRDFSGAASSFLLSLSAMAQRNAMVGILRIFHHNHVQHFRERAQEGHYHRR